MCVKTGTQLTITTTSACTTKAFTNLFPCKLTQPTNPSFNTVLFLKNLLLDYLKSNDNFLNNPFHTWLLAFLVIIYCIISHTSFYSVVQLKKL